MVSYRSAFSIGGSPPSEETTEKNILPSGYARDPTNFLRRRLRERKSREISLFEIILLACPSGMVQTWVAHFVTPLKCTYDEYD